MILTIIAITSAIISVSKSASDKKKARDKYYYTAQSDLLKQKQTSLSQNTEKRQEALKSIAKQYAVNVINENFSLQKQAEEIADNKVKRDKMIAIATGIIALSLISIQILKKN